MARRSWTSIWAKGMASGLAALRKTTPRRLAVPKAAKRAVKQAVRKAVGKAVKTTPRPAGGQWLPGVAVGPAGARRYKLYKPAGLAAGAPVPMIVMLHGCGQDATSFAASTRMNQIAAREGFVVMYPEQDRLANAQGCWNWFDTTSGRAHREAASIIAAIDQVALRLPVDPQRVAVAGLSAGASMAALLAARHPERFKAVVMHSGIPPGTAHSTLTALGAMRGRRATAALDSAHTSAWPPLLVIHGSLDSVVAPRNGRAAAQVWADAVGARAKAARSVQRGKRHPMAVTDFKVDCKTKGHTVATLVEVARLGHAWSGGAASQAFSDAQGPDASRMVWSFASKQFGD
jgi:poly(hydroxyalkanoate) depolymerase family esterase